MPERTEIASASETILPPIRQSEAEGRISRVLSLKWTDAIDRAALCRSMGGGFNLTGQVVDDRGMLETDAKSPWMHEKWLGHGVTGVLLFLGASILFGLPESLAPTSLFRTVPLSVLFGFPLGYTVSRAGGGVVRGAMIGAGFGVVLAVFTAVLRGAESGTLISGAIFGVGILLVPGAILGWHVEADR